MGIAKTNFNLYEDCIKLFKIDDNASYSTAQIIFYVLMPPSQRQAKRRDINEIKDHLELWAAENDR